MEIILQEDPQVDGIQVIIKFNQMDHEVTRLKTILDGFNACMIVNDDGRKKMIHIGDIFYLESVDKKTFVYCKEAVYQTDQRLYQVLEDLQGKGFIQISKSVILNMRTLDSVVPLLNRRLEVQLKNGEKVIATRKYIHRIKHALEEGLYA